MGANKMDTCSGCPIFFIYIHFYPFVIFYRSALLCFFFQKIIYANLCFYCFMFFGTEVLHGIYYNIKIIRSHSDLAVVREADKGYRNFPAIMAEIKKQNPDRQLFVTSPDQYYLHAASQLGYKAIFDYENLWHALI